MLRQVLCSKKQLRDRCFHEIYSKYLHQQWWAFYSLHFTRYLLLFFVTSYLTGIAWKWPVIAIILLIFPMLSFDLYICFNTDNHKHSHQGVFLLDNSSKALRFKPIATRVRVKCALKMPKFKGFKLDKVAFRLWKKLHVYNYSVSVFLRQLSKSQ